ncbi:MAG: hypothetical protein CTY38_00935 [Methylotenera sp.]|uniref:hypothetical protein n=1 Tax=Methylotenera sp. TaxID=2051956 RepID=UPI000D402FD0|nr:hypothetical protein [Methylotenera sp.]PPC84643.1 MAG: hypothetical protein CTY38_00935 [Methylotenera sp.]
MDKEQKLNPQIVHDAAAHLFWVLAEPIGIDEATNAVISSNGHCLNEQDFTGKVLGQYGFEKLTVIAQQQFSNAIAAEAYRFAVKGQNMDGIIYGDDAQGCRSPSALNLQTMHLKSIPKRVVVSDSKIVKIGRLCIRHPLPAVVFSDSYPSDNFFEVSDTFDALGFHLPMFITNATTTQLADGLFVSTGVLQIPVPNPRAGDEWGSVIQNSSRFISSIEFYGKNGSSTVSVEW